MHQGCDDKAIPVPYFAACPGRCWKDEGYRHGWISCQSSEQIAMGSKLTNILSKEGTK